MKTKYLLPIAALILALPFQLALAQTALDSESPNLNNPTPQSCGVSLNISDVMRNADDDQNKEADVGTSPHETLDREHIPSLKDDDLKQCVITGTAGPTGGILSLQDVSIQYGILPPNLYGGKLWKDSEKREELTERTWSVEANSSVAVTFYIEGYENCMQKDQIQMKATMDCPGGTVAGVAYLPAHAETLDSATVWEADLDIDSRNICGTERPLWGIDTQDDKIEHCEEAAQPGKYVVTGINKDSDEDGTPDFADGLGLPAATGSGSSGPCGAGSKLVPVRVLLSSPIDPLRAVVKFSYEASIPRRGSDIYIDGIGLEGNPRQYHVNKAGMRLWAVDAPDREPIPETGLDVAKGDPKRKFIPPDTEIEWETLVAATGAPSGATKLYLFLEYVEAPLPGAGLSALAGQRKSIDFVEVAESGGLAQDTVHVTLVPVEFITPAGDPVNAPVDAGTTPVSIPDGANEFTFSTATSGVLTMKLKAKVPGIGSMSAVEQAKFMFEIDAIGSSTFAWDGANPGGNATVSGDFITATATYTGLPQNNTDFGLKKARVKHGGNNAGEAKFEVFFPIDTSNPGRICNHPGGKMNTWNPVTRTLAPGDVPNWYYYWRQLPEAQGVNLAYGGPTINGAVPAMTDWAYGRKIDKTLVLIGEQAYVAGQAYGAGEFVSGIDWFGNTLVHEGRHVWQIAQYDALVPTGTANTPWEHGWAINQGANHNHWTKGADGQPGEAAVDDDGDGQVDNLFAAGPGELGKFNPATPAANRDQNLTHPNLANPANTNWPAALSYPNPMLNPQSEAESDAINHANANYDEHRNARKDWGNPGKNHKTLDKWND